MAIVLAARIRVDAVVLRVRPKQLLQLAAGGIAGIGQRNTNACTRGSLKRQAQQCSAIQRQIAWVQLILCLFLG